MLNRQLATKIGLTEPTCRMRRAAHCHFCSMPARQFLEYKNGRRELRCAKHALPEPPKAEDNRHDD